MKTLFRTLRRIPWYGWVLGLFYFILQFAMYQAAHQLSIASGTIERAFLPKIPALDDRIPLLPVFILPYIYSYIFWIMAPAFASLTEKRHFLNYIIGLTAACFAGSLLMLLLPTYMDRTAEGLMEAAARPGLLNGLMAWVYANDGSVRAYNLFPSFHCMLSVYSYLAIRRREELPRGIRIYTLIMAVVICISTVTTKQHYVPDVFGGVALALVCDIITRRIDPAGRILKRRAAGRS